MKITLRQKFHLLASSAILLTAVGCGKVGGGAGVVPDVTFIPAGAEETSDSGGDSAEAGATAYGSFTGRVVLTAPVSALPLIVKQGAEIKDKEVCAAVDVPDERLVVSADGGVANAFVYLSKAPKGGKPPASAADPFMFDQKNCRFFPHSVVLPVNTVVRVLSNDSVAHNTHTYPAKNQSVNSGVAPMDRDGKLEIVYRKSESVPLAVKCDYHAWMNAWHLPLDHPYACVTDENGGFSIPDLPAGQHTFVVWHEAANGNFVQRKLAVEIKPGEETDLKIEYPVDLLKL